MESQEIFTKTTSPKQRITQSIMANLTVPGNSILTMPLPDTKVAPEKFRGRYNKVKSFLTHYELLLEQNNVHGEVDKCELVTRYCSRKVAEFIQALPSFSEKKWGKLKNDILKYYDADLDNKKYRIKDLVKLVRACKEKKLKNLSAWREYGRKFITVGGWLLKKNKVSNEEYATYYWNGIPRQLRIKLENRLLAKDPTRSLVTPFRVDEINDAVEALLQRDRFDMNFAGSDDEDDSGDEAGSDDESSDSDEEDELKKMRRRMRKRARFAKGKPTVSESEDSDGEDIRTSGRRMTKDVKRKVNGRDEPEIETLIKQLNSMSIDDPGYAALVFKALKIDPDVLKVVRPPVFVSRPSIPNSPMFPRPQSAFQSRMAPRDMPPRFPPPRPFGRSIPEDDTCFGCGGKGHRMVMCPKLQELIDMKVVMKNGMGRYEYTDGRPIRRLPGETILSAVRNDEDFIKQNGKLKSHLVRVVPSDVNKIDNEVYFGNFDSDTSESEREGDESCEDCMDNVVSAAVMENWDENDEDFQITYPVTRSERAVSAKRREAMEAEYQQPRKRRQANTKEEGIKENKKVPPVKNERAIAQDRSDRPIKPLPTRMQVPVPIGDQRNVTNDKEVQGKRMETRTTRGPVPVDTRTPEYNGRTDDAIMEDIVTRGAQPIRHEAHEVPIKGKPKEVVPANQQAPEKYLRQSEVAAQVKPIGILKQVLDTRINLAIGEVLGISKDISALLGDKIKPKSTRPSVPIAASLPVATSFFTKNRGLLIQLHMQCDGRPITAIIDTGSQLNIVNKNICDTKIMRPVDNKEKISIADANGGQGKLEGMVADVPLHCGNVATSANLYVGTHVPFELLLGRPWQRGNFVSIDERRNGTYLLFKDPKDLKPRYEILVAIDRTTPKIQYELPVWNVPDEPVSYHIMIDQAPEGSEVIASGPTKHFAALNSNHIPFSDAMSTMSNHSLSSYYAITPPSIPLPGSASLMEQQAHGHRKNSDQNPIKTVGERIERLPELDSFLQSMSTELQFKTTEAQVGSSVIPLSNQPLLRLDSEIIVTALADAPFLKRTNNLHPFVLSTADGILLGHQNDPTGQNHADYIFLNAGLFNLSTPPFTITPASAFVRVFPGLSGGPPQPWLLPYLSNPPQNVMVSPFQHYTRPPEYQANETINQFTKGDTKIPILPNPSVIEPQKLTSIREESESAPGRLPSEFSKPQTFLAPATLNHQSPATAVTPYSSSEQNPALVFGKDNIESSYFNSKVSTSSNVITFPESTLASPPASPRRDSSSGDEYSTTSTDIGSSEDLDAEGDVEMEVEMEWQEIKRDIENEVRPETKSESNNKMSSDEDKENAGPMCKINRNVYERIFESYCRIAGNAPTDEIMMELQNSYINLMEHRAAPLATNNPSAPLGANTATLPGLGPVGLGQPVVTSPRASDSYTPIVSSPLAAHSFQPPEPTTVYLVSDISNKSNPNLDEDIPPLEPTSEDTSDAESGKSTGARTPSDHSSPNYLTPALLLDGNAMVQDTKASQGELTKTAPASPILDANTERINRFSRSRKVGRDELIASLELEAAYLRQELTTSEDKKQLDESKAYAQRLGETIKRLSKMEQDRVGEIDLNQLLVAGLMRIMYLAEELAGAPLPHSPPMVPRTAPGTSVESALEYANEDIRKGSIDFEPFPARKEPSTTVYNQPSNKIPQCPSQPLPASDPRSIPIAERPYFPGGANDFVKRTGGTHKQIVVDIRNLSIIAPGDPASTSFARFFTELAGHLAPFIFPGRVAPTHDWPLDVPKTSASNFKERILELRKARKEIEAVYQAVIRTLSKAQIAECLRPHFTLHKRISENSSQLSPIKIDRIYFLQRLHPVWNPLLKPTEAAFLRSAIYMLYGTGKVDRAEELEKILRTPHYDDWEVRELVALGALDNEFREDEALAFFKVLDDEHWEYHANEEALRQSANDILDAMDEDFQDDSGAGKSDNPTKDFAVQTNSGNDDGTCSCAGLHNPNCAGAPVAT